MNFWHFRCMHCKLTLAISHHGFCFRCYRQIKQSPYCGHCGTTLTEYHLGCGECLRYEPKWHRLLQISSYQPPLAEWIQRFKFQHHYWLDKPLARLLLLAVKNAQREHFLTLPEVILPVPLHWKRHWQRGYNQTELLAKPLSRWLNIPLDTQSLKRIQHTAPQRELDAQGRRQNLKGAFAYQPIMPYRSVALLDDVVTTGSTMNAISLELRRQGVQEIQVWTLARA